METKRKARQRRERKEADISWHSKIYEKYEGFCQGCFKWFPRNMVCGHHWFKTKASDPTRRHDVDNGVLLCVACHTGPNGVHNNATKALELKQRLIA